MIKEKIYFLLIIFASFGLPSYVWGQYTDVSIERANSLSSMADFYSSAQNYKKAIDIGKQSLEMFKKLLGNHAEEYAVSASNLARYYYLYGDYNNAVKYQEESIKLYCEQMGKINEGYPELLSVLVEYYHKYGSYQKMIEYQKEITDIYLQLFGRDTEHYALSLAILSQIYSEIGDYSKAIEASEKAIEVYRKGNDIKNMDYMLALNKLADLYFAKGFLSGDDKSKSLSMKEEVVSLAAQHFGKDNINYANWLSNFALYYLNANGSDSKAKKIVQEVKLIYEKEKDKNDTDFSAILGNLSKCMSIIGDNESAIKYSADFLKLLDEYDVSYSFCLNDIAQYYANINNYSRASEYVSLALQSIRKMISHSNDDQDSYRLYLYWNASNLFDTLIKYVSKNPTDSAVSMLFDEAINTRTLRLRNGIEQWYTWKDVRSHLNDEEIAIEFVHYGSVEDNNEYIYALFLKKEMVCPKMVRVSDNIEFKDSLLCATSKYDQDHKLGQIVWGRLAEELGGVKNIYFTPTWTLVAMPAEYFPVNEKQYYNEIYNMYRLSSIRELVERDQDDNHYSNAVLYGGLTYEDAVEGQKADNRSGFEPLMNTKIEIDEISNILRNNAVKMTKNKN